VQNMMEHVINTVDEVSDAITYSATIQRYGRMIFSIGGHGQTNIDITEGV
jgi:tRNA A58 N-methylase Trm61